MVNYQDMQHASPVLIDNSLVLLMLIGIAWAFIKAVDHDDDSDKGALT
jgi:hypothetical protein